MNEYGNKSTNDETREMRLHHIPTSSSRISVKLRECAGWGNMRNGETKREKILQKLWKREKKRVTIILLGFVKKPLILTKGF